MAAVKSKGRMRPHPDFEEGVRYMRVVQAVADSRSRNSWVDSKSRRGGSPFLSKGGGGPGEDVAEQTGYGQGENPGPNNALDYGPLHSAEAFHRAHAHDRSRNDVRSGKRDSVKTRDLNDERGARLRGKSMHRLQFDHLMP